MVYVYKILSCTHGMQWIQQSNSPCQQSVQVCGFNAGMQSNWLITQLINRTVNGTKLSQVSVTIEFQLQECRVELNCQRTFNTHMYETSSVGTAEARNINNYQQVERVSPDEVTGTTINTTININFNTNHSSFHFGIEDETSCIVVSRLIVFYHVCPNQVANLIHFPETIAPIFGSGVPSPPIIVDATCVENAEPENGLVPSVICSSGGAWSLVPGAGCQCVSGYINENGTCRQARKYSQFTESYIWMVILKHE